MPLFCYITDRRAFAGDECARRRSLLGKIAEAARCGVDYIQLREKDLSGRELEALAREAVNAVRENSSTTVLLINSRTDVALGSAAGGVHLPSEGLSPKEVRGIWSQAGRSTGSPVISVSCHSPVQVAQAAADGADFVVFAPVFEKKDAPETNPARLEALHEACGNKLPVLALGGVTLGNAQACMEAGAAGIAAIRLFQDHDIAKVMQSLRR